MKETDAMGKISGILSKFDLETQRRILDWIIEKFKPGKRGGTISRIVSRKVPRKVAKKAAKKK